VVEQLKTRAMPPKSEGPLSEKEYTTLVGGINSILQTSLQEKNPGRVTIRRLSHSEYHYTILDLVGVDFDARIIFLQMDRVVADSITRAVHYSLPLLSLKDIMMRLIQL
jgi:hypothetical protein